MLLHEIYPSSFDFHDIKDKVIKQDDYLLLVDNFSICVKTNNKDLFPKKKDFVNIKSEPKYLGKIDDKRYFLIYDFENEIEINNDFQFVDTFYIRKEMNQKQKWITSMAFNFTNWYKDNKYCGRCGNEMIDSVLSERSLKCSCCSYLTFPRISPAIMVGIINDDKILLAKGKNYRGDFYSLLAGYVEVGETLEEAVIREVKEEVGLDVKNIEYYKNQPWPYTSSLIVGYYAILDGSDKMTLQEEEIEDAKWVSKHEIDNIPGVESLSGEMIKYFAENK